MIQYFKDLVEMKVVYVLWRPYTDEVLAVFSDISLARRAQSRLNNPEELDIRAYELDDTGWLEDM